MSVIGGVLDGPRSLLENYRKKQESGNKTAKWLIPVAIVALLAIIGINMLKEAFDKCESCQEHDADLSAKAMFIMAVATSIDALAVGISLAMAGDVNIVTAVLLIGVITFSLSALGVKVGNVFGSRYEKKAQATGGIILLLLGIKILLEHLGVIG